MTENTIKRYNFFTIREIISEISSEYEKININELNSMSIYSYEKYIFLSCKIQKIKDKNIKNKNKPKATNEHSILQILHNKIITNYFNIFNRNLISFCVRKINNIPYIFSIGCDFQSVNIGQDRTFMTVYSIKIFPINITTHNETDENFLKLLKCINLIRNIDTGEIVTTNTFSKDDEPISEINSFDVNLEGNRIVVGTINGEILLIKNADMNPLTLNKKIKGRIDKNDILLLEKLSKNDITNVKFCKSLNGEDIIYATTNNEIFYYTLNKNTYLFEPKYIYTENGCVKNVFDVCNNGNKVIFCSPVDYSLEEINNFDRGGCWLIEGKKSKVSIFNGNIVFLNGNKLKVYDPLDKCYIYDTNIQKIFNEEKITKINILDFYCSNNLIYLIIEKIISDNDDIITETMNKEIIILREISPNKKLEQFFAKNDFFSAETYVKHKPNLYDIESTYSEIAKHRGDYFYSKGEFKNSVNEYKKTIFHISPELIIEKFLDSSKLEFLIMFLEEINNNIKYNMTLNEIQRKNYIVLLLNCYIRSKKDLKMNEFIQKAYLNKQEVIIRAAIDICKENNLKELALMIVEKGNMVELKIEVLIEIFNNYSEALNLLIKIDNFLFMYFILYKYSHEFIVAEKELFTECYLLLFYAILEIKTGIRKINSTNKKYIEKINKIKYINILNIITDDSLNDIKIHIIDNIINKDKNYPIEVFQQKIEIFISKYISLENNEEKIKCGNQIIRLLKEKGMYKKLDKIYLSILFKSADFIDGLIILNNLNGDKISLLNYYMENDMDKRILAEADEYGAINSNYYIRILNYFLNKYISNDKEKTIIESHIKVLLNKIQEKGFMSPMIIKEISKKLKGKVKFILLKPFIINMMKEKNNALEASENEKEKNKKELDKIKNEIFQLKKKATFIIPKECMYCKENITKEEDAISYLCQHTFHKRCLMAQRENDYDDLECLKCKSKNIQLGQNLKKRSEQTNLHNEYFLELKNKKKKFDLITQYLGKGIFNKIE